MKGKDWKLRAFHGQKLSSRTSATLSLILNGEVSASLISSSSSFGSFGMQVQHQTSTHDGNILSSYGNPCKLNPCPSVCYLHVLTKEQGKGKWALPKKILPRLLKTIWQRKAVWKTLFQNKSSGTINPVYLPQTTPEQNKEGVNQKNTVYHNSSPIFLSCNLGRTFH